MQTGLVRDLTGYRGRAWDAPLIPRAYPAVGTNTEAELTALPGQGDYHGKLAISRVAEHKAYANVPRGDAIKLR